MTTICSLAVIAASLLVVQFISFSTAQVCDLPPDKGPCKKSIERYYYDQKTGTCKTFIYGGCGGNYNNFETKKNCELLCVPVCEQPLDPGSCKKHMQHYYYDHKMGTCETFIYRGCGGNSNNFATKGDCEAFCIPVCEQPRDPGPCKAHVKRYYYDQETETCKDFIYGGCEGNRNNFKTEEECKRICISVCNQPPDPGPCKASIEHYYYDKKTKTCKEFIFGGCDGNGNNFKTKDDCKRICKSV
ncbi:carboxypeptidase inhibitor SmCI-like [Aquarana catesbeiana]|uniref:carboxypeptidase inhibitor SmCI-like n=1 Tax=Aquarana catesbeiana TaxID=8400 RepID=UPI003CC9E83E